MIYFLTIRNGDLDAMSALNKFIQQLSINIFDFLLYRVIPIYAFDLFGREIMNAGDIRILMPCLEEK